MNPLKLSGAMVLARDLLLYAHAGSVRHAIELTDRAEGKVMLPVNAQISDGGAAFGEAARALAEDAPPFPAELQGVA